MSVLLVSLFAARKGRRLLNHNFYHEAKTPQKNPQASSLACSQKGLSVRFSNKHIYAQCIDDEAGRTIVSAHSLSKDLRDSKIKPNVAGGAELGKALAAKAKAAGIATVIFDRGVRRFHGAVKALADAARENGLKF